ncbi:conserved hypothetical protein [Gloeothece citriformis PCC 7424]|uniref:Transporter n=2 Tax=Gloeothece TaxID=28070 RepID=B7KCM9_GLOC7|nr:conserved hypothetical protein [Gloeothece citriformis PCC 7424]
MNIIKKAALPTLLLVLASIVPAKAQLGQIWGDFYGYTLDLQSYVRNNVSQTLKPLEFNVQSSLQEFTGEVNLPNPVLAGERVGNDILFYSLSDKFENNPVVRAQLIQNEIDRLVTLGAISSYWGESGQVRLKNLLDNSQKSINDINQYSQEADQIYQNILSKIASGASQLTGINGITANLSTNQSNLQLLTIKIESEQAKILTENLGQAVKTNQFLLYSNLNLSNIAKQIEETNQSRRVNASAETARLLKITAQADLLGRTDEVNHNNLPDESDSSLNDIPSDEPDSTLNDNLSDEPESTLELGE